MKHTDTNPSIFCSSLIMSGLDQTRKRQSDRQTEKALKAAGRQTDGKITAKCFISGAQIGAAESGDRCASGDDVYNINHDQLVNHDK